MNYFLVTDGQTDRQTDRQTQTDRRKAMHKSPPCMSTDGLKNKITIISRPIIQGMHGCPCDMLANLFDIFCNLFNYSCRYKDAWLWVPPFFIQYLRKLVSQSWTLYSEQTWVRSCFSFGFGFMKPKLLRLKLRLRLQLRGFKNLKLRLRLQLHDSAKASASASASWSQKVKASVLLRYLKKSGLIFDVTDLIWVLHV